MSEPTKSEALERRIDKATTGQTGFTATGSLAFNTMNEIMEFAKVMAIAGIAIPKHLRDNPGACLAVAIQASEWQMSPFAVAGKSYSVNDRLAYEAQLVNAVILRRAPIIGRMRISYSGEGDSRRCKVAAKTNDGDVVDYESPPFGKIPVKNSPLWKGDPDQQLFYYSSRAMCRRHFPDVLLGIYTVDELEESRTERPVSGREVPTAKIPGPHQVPEMFLPRPSGSINADGAPDLTLSADDPTASERFWARIQAFGLNRGAVEDYLTENDVIEFPADFTDEIAAGLLPEVRFSAIVKAMGGAA